MPDGPDIPPVEEGEILFRRIPKSQPWYDPHGDDSHPKWAAYQPNKRDVTGISLVRARFKTIEEAARGAEGKEYFIAKLRASDLIALGLTLRTDAEVELEPGDEPDIAHVSVAELRTETKKAPGTVEILKRLSQLDFGVEGPFPLAGQTPGVTDTCEPRE